MLRRRRALLAAPLATAVVVLAPVTATAAETVLSRFDFAMGVPITDQYGGGVTVFGSPAVVSPGVVDFSGPSVIRVSGRADLDPGSADFSFSTRLRLTRGSGDWNIVQKGYWGDGQYKMSLDKSSDGLRILCRVKGDRGAVTARSEPGSVVEGTWHTVRCERDGNAVRAVVDGVVDDTSTGSIGHVSTSSPYLIGGKEMSKPSRDQYLGQVDWTTVAVG